MSTPSTPGTQTWPAAPTGTDPESGGSGNGVKDHATEAAGTAADQAKQTAGTAAQEGKHVADVAKDEARNVVEESKQQARGLLDEAMTQVDDQARTQRDRLVGTLRTFGDDIEKMANGEQAGSGMAQDLARQVAERARAISSRMDGREPTELLDEVRSFARRRPGTFLLGALAAGVVAGRVTRGAKQASDQDGPTAPSPYDDVRGTATGAPTAGTGYPEATPAYPAGSGYDQPGTTMDQPLGGAGTTGLPGTAPTGDTPWSGEGNRGGTL